MLYRIQGLIFMALGGVSVVEGWHIARVAREGGNFDAVGPDRYLMGVGVALLGLGLWLALNPPQLSKEAQDYRLPADVRTNLIVCLGMLAAFTLALPYVGFTLGCFVFLAVLFKRLSDWSWARSTAAAGVSAAIAYLGLIRFADVPLPGGIIGL